MMFSMVFVDVCIQYLSYQATGLTYIDTHPAWSSTPRLSEVSLSIERTKVDELDSTRRQDATTSRRRVYAFL